MKIITLHCDYIKFKALKKAVKDAEELSSKDEINVKEPLVVLTAVEQGDTSETVTQLIESVKKTASEVKTKNVVLYPYAHLSSNLAKPSEALSLLKLAESQLKKSKFNITRAPFGYYKQFELKCKGHPLSELSKEFRLDYNKKSTSGIVQELEISREELLKKMTKIKMSAKKPPKGLKSNVELGRDLDLYMVSEIIGQGLPLLTPKGTSIRREIERFITDEELRRGYEHTFTPVMAKSDLYKVSGHWQHYKDDMFCLNVRGETFALRPMTCPFQFILYKRKPRSYKEMPKKYAEVAMLFRNEQSGELRGLSRVRQFSLADAHVICRPDQLEKEFEDVLDLINLVMKKLEIDDIWYRFSRWDPKKKGKYINDPESWMASEKQMKKILDKLKIKYKEAKGEAAFYGPKLDIQYKDVYGKEDTLITVQIDFALPERFDMTYIDENNEKKRPIVIHRSSVGALERVISYLLEKNQGALPLWLSPRQVRVVSFTDRNIKACEKFVKELKKQMPLLRIDTDYDSTPVQGKIREAELLKTNYIVVVGDKEEKSNTIAVRPRGKKPQFKVKSTDFINNLIKEINK